MQRNALLFFFSFIFLCTSALHSQGQVTRVNGRVYDPLTNEPIPFASVLFIGTSVGKNTDMDGKFSLETMDVAVSYTHLRAHETVLDLVCRLLLEKKN